MQKRLMIPAFGRSYFAQLLHHEAAIYLLGFLYCAVAWGNWKLNMIVWSIRYCQINTIVLTN